MSGQVLTRAVQDPDLGPRGPNDKGVYVAGLDDGLKVRLTKTLAHDCIRDGIGIAIPQPDRMAAHGNEIDAPFVFARADFVNLH